MKNKLRKIPFFPMVFLCRMAAQNSGVSLRRLHIFLVYLFRYLLLEPFRLAEVFLYDRKIRRHELHHSPIFILGHWRSGTSHLQNLLRQDPTTTSATLYTSIFADNFYITESWLKPVLNFCAKILRAKYAMQRTPMDLDIPAELDSGLCAQCSSASYTWGHLFPKTFTRWIDKNVLFKNKDALDWLDDYDFMIRKLAYRSKSKRVIVKSPGDTARIGLLARRYPKAKFIYIHRNPLAVFHSNTFFWSVILKQNSLQTLPKDEVQAQIIYTYKELLKAYLDQRDQVAVGQCHEVRFEDLHANPLETIKTIYAKLNLGVVPEQAINDFVQASKSYKRKPYSTPPQLQSRLQNEWAFSNRAWPYE